MFFLTEFRALADGPSGFTVEVKSMTREREVFFDAANSWMSGIFLFMNTC